MHHITDNLISLCRLCEAVLPSRGTHADAAQTAGAAAGNGQLQAALVASSGRGIAGMRRPGG